MGRVSDAPAVAARTTVVRIIDRLNVGGPAIHAVLTARGLDRSRFRTILVIGSVEPGEADMGYLLDGTDIEYVVIPSLGRELRPLRDVATMWKLWRVLRRYRPQVVHTHKSKAGALARPLALLMRVPVRVHTYHGHVYSGYFHRAKTLLFLTLERILARTTHRLVALSPRLVDQLSDGYRIAARGRFTVVPLGFDLAPFVAAQSHAGSLRAELGVAAGVPLVGIVGRMVPVKDHATFIDAATLLAARHPDLQLVFVGGGELEPQVREALARNGLQSRAHLLGWRRDLPRLYADLNVVALSSINEGTPVTLVEAMAAGVPVAATRVGGVPDLLRDGARGELAPPRDPSALADAIERALAPQARLRAARIRDEVVAEYGAERLCGDLAALYDELLGYNVRP
jgi:glycosyltransferase involved in cell wall biosynthesis